MFAEMRLRLTMYWDSGATGGNQAGPEQVVGHVNVQVGQGLVAEVVEAYSIQGVC